MIEALNSLDQELFFFLNGLHNPFWDQVMIFITNKKSWYPLYLIIIIFLVYKYKKHIWLAIIMIALTITIADQVSSGYLKPTVKRLRPCKDPAIAERVHIPGGCGGLYGFTSSHASNHFGIAVLLSLLGYKWSRWTLLFIPWAAAIAYSRVYVGVHYPGDVIVGALIGIAGAYISFYIGRFLSQRYKAQLIVN